MTGLRELGRKWTKTTVKKEQNNNKKKYFIVSVNMNATVGGREKAASLGLHANREGFSITAKPCSSEKQPDEGPEVTPFTPTQDSMMDGDGVVSKSLSW